MPDIGWMELLVIGVVALIVVGPKDLPMMFRRLGQFTGRIRAMARDFQRAMDEAADETGMTEINRDLRKATQFGRNPAKASADALKDAFGDIDPDKYPEGSHTRAAAEKRNAAAARARKTAEDLRAARAEAAADELSHETPHDAGDTLKPAATPSSEAEPEPADAGPRRTGTDAP